MIPAPFDPLEALRVLVEGGVRFVVIGGFAGRLHGSPTVTNDIDICYARDERNLQALAAALVALDARLRGAEDVSFRVEAQGLRSGDHFTFVTRAGSLDCIGTPTGTGGFDDLAGAAWRVELDGLEVRVAAIDDLIRMKQAAGRPKDLIEAEVLGAVREEIDVTAAEARAARRRGP